MNLFTTIFLISSCVCVEHDEVLLVGGVALCTCLFVILKKNKPLI